MILVRYFISGGIGASITIGGLYVLRGIFGFWYLASSAAAFACAVIVSFVLQKSWTFQNADKGKAKRQFAAHAALAAVNLGANTFLMYLFVDGLKIWYLASQVFASLIVAAWSFFLYKYGIFKSAANEETQD